MPGRFAEPRFVAVLLIAIGALWVMVQAGYVPVELLHSLARWWPLLLIAAGVGLALPKVGPLPALAAASAVILALALLGDPVPSGDRVTLHVEPLPAPARSVEANLNLASSPVSITVTQQPGVMLAATFTGEPQGQLSARGDVSPRVTVNPRRSFANPFASIGRQSDWQLALTGALPLDLSIEAHSGALELDLRAAQLRRLDLQTGSGSARVQLPAASYAVDLETGSGAVWVDIMPGASVDLRAELASGASEIKVGEGADSRIRLEARSGSLTLDLPDDAPIRLEITDDGSGRVAVPDYLQRRSGSGDTGVWESAALEQGGRVIDIRISDAGSGAIQIR